MDVEFDGGFDLRVFENKKKMMYEIILVSVLVGVKIVYWVGMNILVIVKKAVESIVRICSGNLCFFIEVFLEFSRGFRGYFYKVKRRVVEVVVWLSNWFLGISKGLNIFCKVFFFVREEVNRDVVLGFFTILFFFGSFI